MKKKLLILLMTLIFWNQGFTQSGRGDVTFNPLDTSTGYGAGLDNHYTIGDFYSDGKVILAGEFSTFNGIPVGRVIKLNTEGFLDSSFNNNIYFAGYVTFIKILSDGKILVGGTFSSVDGVPAKQLVRLNVDGSLDTSFSIQDGVSRGIYGTQFFAIEEQPDGKILVTGNFDMYNNVLTNNLIRLNVDGSLDTSFTLGSGARIDGNLSDINTIEVLSNGKIMIGGSFRSFNDVNVKSLAVLNNDGTIDTTFNQNNQGLDSYYTYATPGVNIVKQGPDGGIFVGGDFSLYNGVDVNNFPFLKLNLDGSVDNSFNFNATMPDWTYNYVKSIEFDSDGSIYLGGLLTAVHGYNIFTQTGDIYFYNMIHLSANGTLDLNFNAKIPPTMNTVNTIRSTNNNVYFICSTKEIDGLHLGNKGFIKVNKLGEVDTTFHRPHGLNGFRFYKIKVLSDDKIIITGLFKSYNETIFPEYKSFLKLTKDGLLDTSFNFNDPDLSGLSRVEEINNGKFVGLFGFVPNASKPNLAVINSDGSVDTSFNPSAHIKYAYMFKLQADGKVIVVYEDHQNQKVISRFNIDGSKDTSFTDQIFTTSQNYEVDNSNIFIQSTGKIVIFGPRITLPGNYSSTFFRLNTNGTLDNTFQSGTGFLYNYSTKGAMTSTDKFYLGNASYEYNGIPTQGFIRINADGSLDNSFTHENHFSYNNVFIPNDIKIDKFDNVYVAISEYNNSMNVYQNIVKFNADDTYNSVFTSNMVNAVEKITNNFDFQKDNKIVIIGNFDIIDGYSSLNIGRINNCDANLTSVSISQNAGVLSSTIANQELQWVRCDRGNEVIENATSQSFTPTTNGSYALVAKNGGCPVQSNCIEITNLSSESFDLARIKVYPNPTTGVVNLTLPNVYGKVSTEIYDMAGRLIEKNDFTGVANIPLKIKGSSGIYSIKIKTEDFTVSKKVILK